MKPYAWVSLPENEIQILPFPDDGKTLVAGDGFYLYTHPVKELTDEEIWNFIEEHMGFTFLGRCYRHSQFDMCKAILKKAQTK